MLFNSGCSSPASSDSKVWPKEKANDWYKQKGWQSGCNYIPATAINTIEMWQQESFDPATIDKELGWAEEFGFNTMRVFLNSLVWKNDKDGFKKRIQQYLTISESHKISAIFVLLDDCWNEDCLVNNLIQNREFITQDGYRVRPEVCVQIQQNYIPNWRDM